MKRVLGTAVALMMTVGLAGCGSDSSDTPKKPAKGNFSASPKFMKPGDKDDETTGKILAGTPPKDVIWGIKTVPAGWKKVETEAGTSQWKIADTRCIITLEQPAGFGLDEGKYNDVGLIEQQTKLFLQAVRSTAKATPTDGSLMLDGRIKDSDLRVKQKFATRIFESKNDTKAILLAHRYGNFALLATAACGGGQFDANYPDGMKPFLDSLTVNLTL